MTLQPFQMPAHQPCVTCGTPTLNTRRHQPVCLAAHEDTVPPEILEDRKGRTLNGHLPRPRYQILIPGWAPRYAFTDIQRDTWAGHPGVTFQYRQIKPSGAVGKWEDYQL